MPLVLDTSYIIALVLREGDTPDADTVTEIIATEGAVVPALWRFEVANVLWMAAKRGRIPATRPGEILADLDSLAISIDSAATARAWTATYALAARHDLTVYDAAYLELALRLEIPLASCDHDLLGAARRDSVRVLGRP